jgi:hypothetical protein
VKRLGRIEGGAGKRISGRPHSHYMPRRTDAAGTRRNTVDWEHVHIAVDDYSRLAHAEVLNDEKPLPQPASCVALSATSAATESKSIGS